MDVSRNYQCCSRANCGSGETPSGLGCSQFERELEIDYLEGLDAIPNSVIEGWRGQSIVANEAWVWPRAQILAQFRFVKKRGVYRNKFV